MERIILLCILIPLACLFTGIGIYAWNRKKPMWFWSGSTVKESEISDVRAYNRANGIMWIAFSSVYWIAAILGCFCPEASGPVIGIGTLVGIAALIFAYQKIYQKYRR